MRRPVRFVLRFALLASLVGCRLSCGSSTDVAASLDAPVHAQIVRRTELEQGTGCRSSGGGGRGGGSFDQDDFRRHERAACDLQVDGKEPRRLLGCCLPEGTGGGCTRADSAECTMDLVADGSGGRLAYRASAGWSIVYLGREHVFEDTERRHASELPSWSEVPPFEDRLAYFFVRAHRGVSTGTYAAERAPIVAEISVREPGLAARALAAGLTELAEQTDLLCPRFLEELPAEVRLHLAQLLLPALVDPSASMASRRAAALVAALAGAAHVAPIEEMLTRAAKDGPDPELDVVHAAALHQLTQLAPEAAGSIGCALVSGSDPGDRVRSVSHHAIARARTVCPAITARIGKEPCHFLGWICKAPAAEGDEGGAIERNVMCSPEELARRLAAEASAPFDLAKRVCSRGPSRDFLAAVYAQPRADVSPIGRQIARVAYDPRGDAGYLPHCGGGGVRAGERCDCRRVLCAIPASEVEADLGECHLVFDDAARTVVATNRAGDAGAPTEADERDDAASER
jgi:hypothetical protein